MNPKKGITMFAFAMRFGNHRNYLIALILLIVVVIGLLAYVMYNEENPFPYHPPPVFGPR